MTTSERIQSLQDHIESIKITIATRHLLNLTQTVLDAKSYLAFLPDLNNFKNSFGSYRKQDLLHYLDLFADLLQLVMKDQEHQTQLLASTTPSKQRWLSNSNDGTLFQTLFRSLSAAAATWSLKDHSSALFALTMKYKLLEWQWQPGQPMQAWENILLNLSQSVLHKDVKAPILEIQQLTHDHQQHSDTENYQQLAQQWAKIVFTEIKHSTRPSARSIEDVNHANTLEALMALKNKLHMRLDEFDQWLSVMLFPITRSSQAPIEDRTEALNLLECYFKNRRGAKLTQRVIAISKKQLEINDSLSMKNMIKLASYHPDNKTTFYSPSPTKTKKVAHSAPHYLSRENLNRQTVPCTDTKGKRQLSSWHATFQPRVLFADGNRPNAPK